MASPNERLVELRKRRGFATAKDAAGAFGWKASTYAQHENGIREVSRKAAMKYADAYLSSAGWILYGEKAPRMPAKPPTVRFGGLIGAGQEVVPSSDIESEIDAVVTSDPAEAFEVVGDSMLPVAGPGDILFFAEPSAPSRLIGRECIVELADGRRFFKRLRRGSKAGLYDLESYNTSPITDVEVLRAGPLLGLRRRR